MTDGWMLTGLVKGPDKTFEFKDVRPLATGEYDAAAQSIERLKNFSGHTLVGGLVDALNELNAYISAETAKGPTALWSSEFRSRFNARLSHWLTTFSAFRANLELVVVSAGASWPTNVLDNFVTLYEQHPEYRLTWQLRNLDQHHPPAGGVVSFQESEETAPSLAPVLDLPRLFETQATGSRPKQWRECADLWSNRAPTVDIREVFDQAYRACETVMGAAVTELEPLLLADIDRLANLYVEALPTGGAPCLYTVHFSDGGKTANMQHLPLDQLTLGEALVTLNGARNLLGKAPLDLLTDPRVNATGSKPNAS